MIKQLVVTLGEVTIATIYICPDGTHLIFTNTELVPSPQQRYTAAAAMELVSRLVPEPCREFLKYIETK